MEIKKIRHYLSIILFVVFIFCTIKIIYKEIYKNKGYGEFLPETRQLNDGTLMITKTPIHNPNYFIDDYQREGDI